MGKATLRLFASEDSLDLFASHVLRSFHFCEAIMEEAGKHCENVLQAKALERLVAHMLERKIDLASEDAPAEAEALIDADVKALWPLVDEAVRAEDQAARAVARKVQEDAETAVAEAEG